MSYELVHPVAQRTSVFDEYINEETKDIDLSYIKFNETLNKDVFDGEKIKDSVRKLLIQIVDYFMTSIDSDVIISDVTLTGSIVNYNYNKYSDIDIHIIIDKNDYKTDEEYDNVYELLSAKAKIWNFEHENIKLFDHNIEIYIQEIDERHRSTGVYDIIQNKWIKKPIKEYKEIDKEFLKKKLNSIIYKINKVLETDDLDTVVNFIDNLKLYRTRGLETEGEYSYENLIYKYIKHNKYIENLINLKRKLSI